MSNSRMTMWVVWGFLAVALVVYLWVGLAMVDEGEEAGRGSPVIVGVMGVASAVCGWLSLVVGAVLRGTLVKLEGRDVEPSDNALEPRPRRIVVDPRNRQKSRLFKINRSPNTSSEQSSHRSSPKPNSLVAPRLPVLIKRSEVKWTSGRWR